MSLVKYRKSTIVNQEHYSQEWNFNTEPKVRIFQADTMTQQEILKGILTGRVNNERMCA